MKLRLSRTVNPPQRSSSCNKFSQTFGTPNFFDSSSGPCGAESLPASRPEAGTRGIELRFELFQSNSCIKCNLVFASHCKEPLTAHHFSLFASHFFYYKNTNAKLTAKLSYKKIHKYMYIVQLLVIKIICKEVVIV